MNDAQLSCILKLHMHWKQTKLFCACEIQWLNCKYLSEKMCAGIKPLATKSQIRTDLGVLIFYVSPLKVSNYLPQYIAKHLSQQKHSESWTGYIFGRKRDWIIKEWWKRIQHLYISPNHTWNELFEQTAKTADTCTINTKKQREQNTDLADRWLCPLKYFKRDRLCRYWTV